MGSTNCVIGKLVLLFAFAGACSVGEEGSIENPDKGDSLGGPDAGSPGTPNTDPDASRPRSNDGAPGEPDIDAAVVVPDIDAAVVDTGLSAAEQELFVVINRERVARGLTEVVLDDALNCAAARHSADIGETRTCSHTGSDGSDPGSRVAACGGGRWSGEIVACGQRSPEAAVQAWIGSPGHNRVMFTPGQRTIGVAMHNNFWTAIFNQ